MRKHLDERLTEYHFARVAVKRERLAFVKAEQNHLACLEAQTLLQDTAKEVQAQVHGQIATVVKRCLEAVFPDPYDFKIDFRKMRGKTEAKLIFIRDGNELEDPLNEAGGGPVDVACFGLRLACLSLIRPKRRMMLILDEPFRNLSESYQRMVPNLLMELAKKMKLQILMTTNSEALQTGKVIRLNT